MISIYDDQLNHTCAGATRREFLRVGGLALGGLSLPQLLAARAETAKAKKPIARDVSVVLLFLQGGPSHIEFFDPKMTAPAEIRSITGEVQTRTPGVTFGGTFPRLAAMSDKFSVVRSYASGNGGHSYNAVASGGNPFKAAAGAVYSRLAGTTHPHTGMPSNVLVLPEAVDPNLKLQKNFETGALPTLTSPGDLGAAYGAFDPSGGGQLLENLRLRVPADRFTDRRRLLTEVDSLRRRLDATGDLDGASSSQQRAYEVLLRGIADAFDLRREGRRTLEKYDTSGLFRAEDVTKWFDMRRGSNLLGKQMLMARRLCEAGAGFVTVSDCGWDMHANKNSPAKMELLPAMTSQVDRAVSAFIDDVEARGLSEKILLVVTGEMGRTPRLNKTGGRDHWANLTTLLVYGGGLKMGQVIGASDRQAGTPATTRYTPANLMATVWQAMFDAGELRVSSDAPKNVASLVTDGRPIAELV